MNKFIVLILLSVPLLISTTKAQKACTLYLFPGQGSDERLFDSLQLKDTYEIVDIKYAIPEKGTSLAEYAKVISGQIDTTESYIFIGTSLGGMIISELNQYLHPYQSIIISSAKYRSELPFRYRFQKYIPVYRLIPPKIIMAGAKLMQPIVEPDRNTNKETFKSMLGAKDPIYLKRTVDMIIRWDKTESSSPIIHIHGSKDRTIPIRNVHPTYTIPGGSHMMTLTEPDQINDLLETYLAL